MAIGKLSAGFVEKARKGQVQANRRFSDGGGLALRVTETGAASWVYRYRRDGKETFMGLGSLQALTLAQARRLADEQRRIGTTTDPLLHRRRERKAELAERGRAVTFADLAADMLAQVEASALADTSKADWRRHLGTATDLLGRHAVAELTRADVLDALATLRDRPTVAKHVRQKVEATLDLALAREMISINPARAADLRAATRFATHTATPHRAAPWADVPAMFAALGDDAAGECVRFIVLTGVRRDEARGMTLEEVDLAAAVWTIPASRMKTRREHRVPLSPAAVALLRRQPRRNGPYLFTGRWSHQQVSATSMQRALKAAGIFGRCTIHGFRTCLRSWCADTGVDGDVAEACLAHVVKGVEGRYQRSDLLERRRPVMDRWQAFVSP